MENLCMGCMNPLAEGQDTCSVCGFSRKDQNPAGALPVGTVLQERYLVGRLMSETGDCLHYLGYNRLLKEPCFVQEFYPASICGRGTNGLLVQPISGCEGIFADQRNVFASTARALARLKELPGLIPLYDIFEENGSYYAVSDYCAGMTLTRKLKLSGGRIPWNDARPLFNSLLSCLEQLHAAGIRHLAITPDNILISPDGKAHLRNFSVPAIHTATGELEPRFFAGFTAPEQYKSPSVITDACDVYGLAATLFRAVTGNTPPAGNTRAKDSDDLFMPAEVAEELSNQVCVALFNALQVDPEQRIGSMAEFHNQLSTEPHISDLRDEAKEDMKPVPGKKKNPLLPILIAVAAVAVVVVACLLLLGPKDPTPQQDPEESTTAEIPTLPPTTTTQKVEKMYSVPDFRGKVATSIKDPNFKVAVKYLAYSDKPAGTVVEQIPNPAESAPKGTLVELVISTGKTEDLTVPDVANWNYQQAQLYLEALGFKVDIARLQASTVAKGLVEGSEPAPGTKKKLGDTVTLRVSDVEPVLDEPTAPPVSDPTTAAQTEPTQEAVQ